MQSSSSPTFSIALRSRALLLLSVVILYYAGADVFVQHAALLVPAAWFALAYQGLRLGLLLAGLALVARFWPLGAAVHQGSILPPEASALGWRWSPRAGIELGRGAALGWAMVVALAVPLLFTGGLQIYFDWTSSAWGRLLLVLLATAAGAAVRQTMLSGFGFRRLCDATNTPIAVVAVAMFAGFTQIESLHGSWLGVLVVVLFQALCCVAALRTGSLWFGLGMDFAVRIALGTALGLPVLGDGSYSSIVLAGTPAPEWLAGSVYGPAAGVPAPIILLLAIPVLLAMTEIDRIAMIRPGGIPVFIAEKHAPEFPAVAPPPPAGVGLVQIGALPPVDIPLPPKPQ